MGEPHGFPSKRLRTPPPMLSPSPGGKGKATMEESSEAEEEVGEDPAAAAEGRTCGICFTEEGLSIRGSIDSCDHYFCFVCIMEWGKIESRCPLCKQRFGSIRRPPVRGVFFGERVVHVPVRDQVHQLFGNATGDADPYANIACSACHKSTDENLLLLCDLCDSAAHTYCVGLGFTVPEGDWYCNDCTILRTEHSKLQDDDYCLNEHFNRFQRTTVEDGSPISISEIVRDETSSNSFCGSRVRVMGRGTNDERTIPERGVAEREPQDRAAVERNSQGNSLHSDERPSHLAPVRDSKTFPESKLTELGARTLRQCRSLHLRIRILRENWFALQSGYLDFKSSLVSSSGTSIKQKHNNMAVTSSISTRQEEYQSSADKEEVTAGSRVSSEMNSYTNSHDVNKAWKMLDIAKSMQRAQAGARSSYQSPKLYGKKSICENKVLEHRVLQSISDHKTPGCPVSRKVPEGKIHENRFGVTASSKSFSHSYPEIVQENCKLPNCEKQRPGKPAMEELGRYDNGSSSSARQNLKSNRELYYETEGLESTHAISHKSRSERLTDIPACSGSSNHIQAGTSRLSASKEPAESVGCKVLPHNVKSALKNNADEGCTRICDSAKSEIQSLVKLNLKLQCKGSHLGTEKFKEIARVATHTILAACGLEHSRPNSRPFSGTICRHGDHAKLLHRSNLMPDSCRECFFSFVKNVVDSIVSEKTNLSNSS